MKTKLFIAFLLLLTVQLFAGPSVTITFYNSSDCNLVNVDGGYQAEGTAVWNGSPTWPDVAAHSSASYTIDNAGGGHSGQNDGCRCRINWLYKYRFPDGSFATGAIFTITDTADPQFTGQGFDYVATTCTPPPPPPPSTTNITLCVKNPTANPVYGYFNYPDGTVEQTIIQPGETACRTVTVVLDGSSNFSAGWKAQPTTPNPNSDDPYSNTNGSFTSFGGTNYPGSGFQYTNTVTGNSSTIIYSNNIQYPSSTGNPAQDPTLKAGLGALHQDNVNSLAGLQILHTDLNGLKTLGVMMTNELGQIIMAIYHQTNNDQMPVFIHAVTNNASGNANAIVAAIRSLTNSLTLTGTNHVIDSSAENSLRGISNLLSDLTDSPTNADIATESTQVGISNLLANGVTSKLTNYSTESTLRGISNLLSSFKTNGGTATMAGSAVTTNAAAAESAAATVEGNYGVDGLISQVAPALPGTGSGANMTMSFCGMTIDLDPVHQFPTLSFACLLGFKIMLLIGFVFEAARMFWKLIEIKASTETGGVPDLEIFGGGSFLGIGGEAGGNFLGAIVALAVPVAFITLFSVGMAYLFSNLGVSITDAMQISTWTNSLGSIGYYLLSSFFPVNLFFSLLFTRITLSFTLAKIVALAADAARFLWGK